MTVPPSSDPLPPGFAIRPARAQEVARLPALERVAGRRFAEIPGLEKVAEGVSSVEDLAAAEQAGRLWVALDRQRVIGFACADVIDGDLHLAEVSVLPQFGRRGLGTGLVHQVCDHAEEHGFAAVTLTTFRDVPWNEPFYRRLGFVELEGSIGPEFERQLAQEAESGLDPQLRLVMRWRPRDRSG